MFTWLISCLLHDQEKFSKFIGKSRSYIANSLRLLSLPNEVIKLIEDQKISAGHAKILVGLENAIFIAEQGITNPKTLVPMQMCNYKRISMMDYGASERLTFDFHLHYNCRYENSNKRFDKEANFELGDFVIAELKQNKLRLNNKK